MPRIWLLLLSMVSATLVAGGGCRSCSTCHDYDPPVANCDCNACGCHRAGSASGGYADSEYSSEEYVVEPHISGPTMQEGDHAAQPAEAAASEPQ